MSPKRHRSRALFTGLCLLLSGGAVAALSSPPRPEWRGSYKAPLLPDLQFIRLIGRSQLPLVVDYYWIQAIQSAGRAGSSLERERWLDLYYLADFITDLDPKFHFVYKFSGNTIPTNLGRETWINTTEAREILEKGVKNFPNDLSLRLYLAYNLSFFHNDHAKAAKLLEETSRLPGADFLISEMASRLLAHTGRFEAAIAVATQMRDQEQDPELKEVLDRRVKEVERERVLVAVDSAIRSFREREGRLPHGVDELLARGDLPRAPVDPMGGLIILGKDGRSTTTASHLRLEPMDWKKRAAMKEAEGK